MFHSWIDRLRPGLAVKFGILVLGSTGLIFVLAFAASHRVASRLMLGTVEEDTRNLARNTVNRLEAVLLSVEPLCKVMADRLSHERPSPEELTRMLDGTLQAAPHVFGSAIAFEPGAFARDRAAFAPYRYRTADGLGFSDLGVGSYDYFSWDWYIIPRETGRPGWSDPYFDEGGGNAMMCTYWVPFYRLTNGMRTFAGVVTADVRLERLAQIVASLKLPRGGFAFLLSQNGQFISHPDTNLVFTESIFSVAEEAGDRQLREVGRRMVRGQEGFERIDAPGTRAISWLYYAPVSASGWSMGIVFPEQAVLAGLRDMDRVVFWIGSTGFSLLLVVIALLAVRVTRPIRMLARQTHEIARGNLDLPVPAVTSQDEVGDLSQSFEDMRVALKEYIANLADTTAAKERIESELKIAQTIQRSFLPKRFPPFPDRKEFDLHAELQPAREIGGDLYDFFLLDPQRLFFAVGDVSGKGVPAALFMAVTKTLLKGVSEQQGTPAQVLAKVNRELYVDNEQM
ncbi:MAG: HAMP domain-containing protein, partial [Verrucomicrobia bacterium]|nr:HAMP domain-containing protein [Verrucomicrobiota bacterium]